MSNLLEKVLVKYLEESNAIQTVHLVVIDGVELAARKVDNFPQSHTTSHFQACIYLPPLARSYHVVQVVVWVDPVWALILVPFLAFFATTERHCLACIRNNLTIYNSPNLL